MPTQHALLSASSSARWLACPPSARFEQQFPSDGKASIYAVEGTKAHAVAEDTLKTYLRKGTIEILGADDGEMEEAVRYYVDTVLEKLNAARRSSSDAKLLVEQKLDYSRWVPEGFGTGDSVIISDGCLEICDLKYGKGVRVDAHKNSQMRLYALGALDTYGFMYGFDKIRMTIIQPRIDNISSEEISVDDLLSWAYQVKKIAGLAFDGLGSFKAGPHCRFCKGKVRCRTYADYMRKVIRDSLKPNELSDSDLAETILKAKEIKSWLDGVEDYALIEATKGHKWPGLKLVRGRSNRKIVDPEKAAEILQADGFTEIYKPKELKTITALEKLCGKKRFASLLSSVIEKPEGKPALVSLDDKRPEINTKEETKNDFKEGDKLL